MVENDGGPAFPAQIFEDGEDGPTMESLPGMSLRDWFAGQAAPGFLALVAANRMDLRDVPSACKEFADDMLAERSKPQGGDHE